MCQVSPTPRIFSICSLKHPPPNVIMGDIRLLFYCHHCYTGVNLRWQWNLDLILVAIHPTKHKSFGWMVAHYWYQQESTNKRRWSSACRFHKPREIFSIYPTCMPSSISIVETLSPSPTTNCKTKKESKIHGQLSPLTITCTQKIVYYLLAPYRYVGAENRQQPQLQLEFLEHVKAEDVCRLVGVSRMAQRPRGVSRYTTPRSSSLRRPTSCVSCIARRPK
jgi:hypothetical protein